MKSFFFVVFECVCICLPISFIFRPSTILIIIISYRFPLMLSCVPFSHSFYDFVQFIVCYIFFGISVPQCIYAWCFFLSHSLAVFLEYYLVTFNVAHHDTGFKKKAKAEKSKANIEKKNTFNIFVVSSNTFTWQKKLCTLGNNRFLKYANQNKTNIN